MESLTINALNQEIISILQDYLSGKKRREVKMRARIVYQRYISLQPVLHPTIVRGLVYLNWIGWPDPPQPPPPAPETIRELINQLQARGSSEGQLRKTQRTAVPSGECPREEAPTRRRDGQPSKPRSR